MDKKNTKKSSKSTLTKPRRKKQGARTKKPDDSWKYKYKFYSQTYVPEAALEDLAEHMIEWASNNPDALIFGDFLYEYKIARSTMDKFLKRCEKLRKAKRFAMDMIGNNREKGALKKQIDFNTMKVKQYQYDPDWGLAEERQYKLKSSLDENSLTKEDFQSALKEILKPVDKEND